MGVRCCNPLCGTCSVLASFSLQTLCHSRTGPCLALVQIVPQMPTGTGKTITLLSLITSYQLAHPEVCQACGRHAFSICWAVFVSVHCTRHAPPMHAPCHPCCTTKHTQSSAAAEPDRPDCHCFLQRPSTAAEVLLIVLWQVGKLIYCTRTVPEMEKVLTELQVGQGGWHADTAIDVAWFLQLQVAHETRCMWS
jgi:hypothetical protein